MTAIIPPRNFESKAKLQALLTAKAGYVFMEDPSIMKPFRGTVAEYLAVGQSVVVTNHPLRTKFAKVLRTGENDWKVS